MATLGLKEMEKFLWEGGEKSLPCWLSQFSETKLRQPTGQTGIMKSGLDAMPLFILDDLLNTFCNVIKDQKIFSYNNAIGKSNLFKPMKFRDVVPNQGIDWVI